MCACVYTCVRDVFAIYDNNILPRLIMIITKITFLSFLKIAQTDDFPSTGSRLVYKTVVLFITVVFYFCLIRCFVFSVCIDGRRVIAPLHLAP